MTSEKAAGRQRVTNSVPEYMPKEDFQGAGKIYIGTTLRILPEQAMSFSITLLRFNNTFSNALHAHGAEVGDTPKNITCDGSKSYVGV